MSPTNRALSRPGLALEKKLAAYSLAGAAVLVSPNLAKADVIYSGNVDETFTQSNSFALNLSNSTNPDVTVSNTTGTLPNGDPGNLVNVSTANGAQVLLESSGAPLSENLAALAMGALIDPNNPTAAGSAGNAYTWGSGGKLVGYDTNNKVLYGNWEDGNPHYFGFYFEGTNGPQAGWVDVIATADMNGSSFEILSYAYETVANTPIMAGQVPEPSAIALIALGGAGLLALRRRRAAHA